mmetsp:Transcript_129763/g.276925  ORF Transcript_129763/g.276925 Transcript_129763/m.276925 type:complete len:235 (-) Transcript_129763:950-1654(-)
MGESVLHRDRTLLRVECHQLLAQVPCQWEVRPRLLLPLQDFLLQGIVHLSGSRASYSAVLQRHKGAPWRFPRHQDVEDNTDGPEVGLWGNLPKEGFGRDVAGRAHKAGGLGACWCPLHTSVKVDQLHRLWRLGVVSNQVEHDVLGLHVSMNKASFVQVPNGDENLANDPLALALSDLGLRDQEFKKLAAVALRHDNVKSLVVLQDLVDVEDMLASSHLVHLGHDRPPRALTALV